MTITAWPWTLFPCAPLKSTHTHSHTHASRKNIYLILHFASYSMTCAKGSVAAVWLGLK